MSDVTTRWGITEPASNRLDAADVPFYIRQAVQALEAKGIMYGQGPIASRPVSTGGTPGIEGRIYVSTDETPRVIYWDYGTGWIPANALADASIVEAKLLLADNTTGDVSTARHGFVPKATNTGNKFLRDNATWDTPTIVATSKAGLGTGWDGKNGVLRLGSTPYQFIYVTWDATYGKWISREDTVWSANAIDGTNGPQLDLTGISGAANYWFATPLVRAGEAITAGMALKARITGDFYAVSSSGNVNLIWGVAHGQVADPGVTIVLGGAIAGTTIAAGSRTLFDSGWVTVTGTYALGGVAIGVSPNGTTHIKVGGSAALRWEG